MDFSTTLIFFVIFFSIWVQLSSFSFMFCSLLSCFVVIILIYFLVITDTLLPTEQPLLHLFIKELKIGRKKINENLRENEIAFNYDDEISRKLRELIGHIVRDFILDWYNTVSDDVHFVQEAFELFEFLFTEVRKRVSLVDSNKLTLVLLSRLTHHYSCYKKALEYAGPAQHDSQRREQLVVVSYEKLNGHLAMSNPPDTENDHIRSIVTVLLKGLLPEDYTLSGSGLYLVRELISQNVLSSFIDMLSDPNWINSVIPKILDDDVIVDDDDDVMKNVSDEDSQSSEDTQTSSTTDENKIESNQNVESNKNTPSSEVKFVDDIPDLSVRYSQIENKLNQDEIDLTQIQSTSQASHENHRERNPTIMSDSSQSISSEQEIDDSLPLSANQSHFSQIIDTSHTHSFVSTKLLRTKPSTSGGSTAKEKPMFQRIKITKAINIEETFEGGAKYTLYKIQYFSPFNNNDKNKINEQNADDHSNLEEFQVQRRFREFLTLQESLNENKLIRKIVLKVKGPSRMFPMPIGNMDKEYIEKRRRFLQAYLRELCFYPEVAKSPELREFFAYNSDPRIAYVRKPSEYIPRFDKMLKSAFQELIGSASLKINETFQIDDSQKLLQIEDIAIIKPESLPISIPSTTEPTTNNTNEPSFSNSQQNKLRGPVTMLKSIVYGKKTDLAVFESGIRDYQPFNGPKNANEMSFGWRLPDNILQNRTRFHSHYSAIRRTQADGCDQPSNFNEGVVVNLNEYALPGQVFNLVFHVWGIKLGIHTLSFLAVARFVKEFVSVKTKQLTQKEMWIHYLHILQTSLWPNGEWEKQINQNPIEPEINRAKAQQSLEETFPGVLKYIVGDQGYSNGVKELLDSFQNPGVNRHLVFHLIDILLQTIFPDLQNVIYNRRNISL